jgi:hypothetical protein
MRMTAWDFTTDLLAVGSGAGRRMTFGYVAALHASGHGVLTRDRDGGSTAT